MSTPFKPEPFEITDKKGSMITAQNAEHTITRNASSFKKLSSNIPVHPKEEQTTPFIDAAEEVEPTETVEPPIVTLVESPRNAPVAPPGNASVEPPTVIPVELPPLHRSARARQVPDHFKRLCYLNITQINGLVKRTIIA